MSERPQVRYATCINCAAGDTRLLPLDVRSTVTEFIPPPGEPGNWLGDGNVGPFCAKCWAAIFGENANRASAFAAIDGERAYQDRRWPGPEHRHEVESFLVYIRHYVRKAEDTTSTVDCTHHLNRLKVMDTIRKIAALAVAAMEQHGVVARGQNVR